MEQAETMNGGIQTAPLSNYQAAGYRLPLGRTVLRAAERLLDREAGSSEATRPTAEQADPDTDDPETATKQGRLPLANVYADPNRHTVSFLLDDATASTVIYAVRLFAADAEAHAREVRFVGATLPPDSYGAANRQAIAARHERLAARLRTLESNYRSMVQ